MYANPWSGGCTSRRSTNRSSTPAAKELTSRLGTALAEYWPAGVDLKQYELAFSKDNSVVRLRYKSPAPLDEPAKEMITRLLRSHLDAPDLKIEFEQLGRD